MYLNSPFYDSSCFSGLNRSPQSYKPFDKALQLIKEAFDVEKEAELLLNYLICEAPSEMQKNIIISILDDEKKHYKFFREIYSFYAGKNASVSTNVDFEKPESYIDGIKQAKCGELSSVERCRDIRAGIPDRYYRDMIFEVITDDLNHANKYDCLLYLNLESKLLSSSTYPQNLVSKPKPCYTTEDASKIAQSLGINFNEEKFDLQQFTMGLNIELEHGKKCHATNVTEDDPIITGKITLAHLKEYPDYYTRLAKLEKEAKAFWTTNPDSFRQTKEFTLAELAQYDGSMGKPAYVVVDGIVYDISAEATWGGGSHFGLNAGKDLTSQFYSCHGNQDLLSKLPKVGILKI